MLLIAAATESELAPLREVLSSVKDFAFLVTGVGPLESGVVATRYFAAHQGSISAVVNLGVAGAYCGSGLGLLDLCLAEREVLAELGICLDSGIEDFDPDKLTVVKEFPLDPGLLGRAASHFAERGLPVRTGSFVTVSCTSGTQRRGDYLAARYGAICENMEGAALARACREFGLPLLELRAVSNLVEDRDPGRWRLAEACRAVCEAARHLLPALAGF